MNKIVPDRALRMCFHGNRTLCLLRRVGLVLLMWSHWFGFPPVSEVPCPMLRTTSRSTMNRQVKKKPKCSKKIPKKHNFKRRKFEKQTNNKIEIVDSDEKETVHRLFGENADNDACVHEASRFNRYYTEFGDFKQFEEGSFHDARLPIDDDSITLESRSSEDLDLDLDLELDLELDSDASGSTLDSESIFSSRRTSIIGAHSKQTENSMIQTRRSRTSALATQEKEFKATILIRKPLTSSELSVLPDGYQQRMKNDCLIIPVDGEKFEITHNHYFTMIGSGTLQVLRGEVEVFGARINKNRGIVPIECNARHTNALLRLIIPSDGDDTATIILRSSEHCVAHEPLRVIESSNCDTSRYSAIVIPQNWQQSVSNLLNDMEKASNRLLSRRHLNEPTPLCFACFGARKVGKSTLARYLVNRLFDKFKHVAWLEGDVGQSEFTVSGMVSLCVLNAPLLCPTATCFVEPTACYYIGNVNPADDPDMYLLQLNAAFSEYQKLASQTPDALPLVLNTQGWVKGLGKDLLTATLEFVKPSTLIEFIDDNADDDEDLLNLSALSFSTVHHTVNRFIAAEGSSKDRFTAEQVRLDRLSEYFAPTIVNTSSLPHSIMSLPCYRVPLSSIRIELINGDGRNCTVAPDSLTCTLVALCSSKYSNMHSNNISKSLQCESFFSEKNLPLCLGLGIVQYISQAEDAIFIRTPLNSTRLMHVDVIVRGTMNFPSSFYCLSDERAPYLSPAHLLLSIDAGGGTMKSRGNLLRQRFQVT